jgi:hypothetical protein
MSQVTGTLPFIGGLHLGAGASGPCGIFFGAVDPSTVNDPAADRVNVSNASPGSLFLRTDTGALYVKSAAGAWTQVTIP